MPVPDFYKRLVMQRRTLLFVMLCACTLAVVGASHLVVLGLSALDAVDAWQERTAFFVRALTYGLLTTVWTLGVVTLLFRRPSLTQLAQTVENRHPQFMDALTCAVEIQATHGGPRNDLEEALFRQVDREAEGMNFTTAILPQKLHPLIVVGLGVIVMVFADMASQSSVQKKFTFYVRDMLSGQATGLHVEPASTERPRGSDLTVLAKIMRWEQAARIEYQTGTARTETYPMYLNAEGVAEFTFYGLETDIRYRVKTPSLQSPWYRLHVFDPPTIQSIELELTPPQYTGEEPSSFSKWVDLFVTEGTRIQYKIAVNADVSAKLVTTSSEFTFRPLDERDATEGLQWLQADFIPAANTDYRIRLVNAAGRTFITESHQIEVIPDELPVIEWIEPGRDIDAEPMDAIPLEIYVADDYSVDRVEITVSVSGLPRQPIRVFQRDAETAPVLEQNFFSTLELQLLGVEPGDIVAYHATVWDNKEPVAQEVHSDKFFVEVKGPVPESDPLSMAGGAGPNGETVEVDFRAMIIELKRLIRESHATQFLQGEERERNRIDIGAGLSALHDEGNTILGKIQGMLQAAERGEIYLLFKHTLEQMDRAERSVNAKQLEAAIPMMEEAYSGLLNLERYFESQQQNQQQGEGGEGGNTATAETEQEAAPTEEAGMSIAELRQALDSVQSLIDKQSAMNSRFARAERTQPSQAEQLELANLQSAIEGDTADLETLLKNDPDSFPVRRHLRMGHEEMNQAAASAAQDEMARANRFGLRAKEDLLSASSLLSARIREQALHKMDGLAQQAGSLASAQDQASQASKAAAQAQEDGAGERLRAEQDALKQRFDRLVAGMDRTSIDLEETFPEVSEALAKLARESAAKNIDGTMAKATNALLYERFRRAAQSQDKATASLQELSQGLEQTTQMVPRMSAEEMQHLLEKLLAANEQMQASAQSGEGEQTGSGEQRGKQGMQGQGQSGSSEQAMAAEQGEGQEGQAGQSGQQAQGQPGETAMEGGQTGGTASQPNSVLAEKLAQELNRAGRILKDTELSRLGAELAAPDAASSSPNGEEATPKQLLEQAIRVVQQRIQQTFVEERSRLNRRSAAPPEKYRSLVEEYFRNLAEEN